MLELATGARALLGVGSETPAKAKLPVALNSGIEFEKEDRNFQQGNLSSFNV